MNENTKNRRGFLKTFSASAIGISLATSLNPTKMFAKKEHNKTDKFEISIHPSAVKRIK